MHQFLHSFSTARAFLETNYLKPVTFEYCSGQRVHAMHAKIVARGPYIDSLTEPLPGKPKNGPRKRNSAGAVGVDD